MKKSLKKQAVFPVLMLLVVTALALIGSSFAWFSMNSVAHLSTVSGTVEDSSVGLMISVDGSTFKSSVNLATDSPVTFVNPYRFHQMSTTNARTFYEATITQKDTSGIATMITSAASTHDPVAGTDADAGKLFGWISDHATPTPNTQNLASGAQSGTMSTVTYNNEAGYMVFDLFFSVENAATLYLDNGTTFTQDTEAPNASFRVAFFDLGTEETGSAAIALDYTNSSAPTVIWDPAGDTSYYGLNNASSTEFAPYVSSANSSLVTTYASSSLYTNTNWSDTNKPSEYSATTIQSIASLAAGVTKVRVVVWLEGNDVSCVSKIANTAMSIKLDFYAEKD